MSFVFYDLETTGTNPSYDQPLQFAAIRTDSDLREVDRINLRCRLAPHILPSPSALVVTVITAEQLTDPALPSWFEMMAKIQTLTKAWGPSTWTGYNSIAFDEAFLRAGFYQTLQPEIYATQGSSNQRLDLMTLVYAVHAWAPDTLVWPTDDSGKVSFKLDRLAPANGFESDSFHDALADVEATIHLLRLIRDKAPHLHAMALANRDKAHVKMLLNSGQPVEMIARYGGGEPRSFVGVGCGFDAGSKNTAALFDVRADKPADVVDLRGDDLQSLLNRSPRVIRKIKINETPMLFPAREDSITQGDRDRCAIIHGDKAFRDAVGEAMRQQTAERYPPPDADAPPPGIEERMFYGFYSRTDKLRLEDFHRTPSPQGKLEIVSDFEDERLRALGARMVMLTGRGVGFTDAAREAAARNILTKWRSNEPDAPWTTLAAADAEITAMLELGRMTIEKAADIRAFIAQRVTDLEAGRLTVM